MQQLTDSPPTIPTEQQQQQQQQQLVRGVKVQPEKAKKSSSSSSSSSKMTAGQAAVNRAMQPEQLVTVRRILADDAVAQSECCCVRCPASFALFDCSWCVRF
jgi:hypothetical protein